MNSQPLSGGSSVALSVFYGRLDQFRFQQLGCFGQQVRLVGCKCLCCPGSQRSAQRLVRTCHRTLWLLEATKRVGADLGLTRLVGCLDDDASQFADVSRVRATTQCSQGFRREYSITVRAGVVQEVLSKPGNIFHPVTQRWHVDVNRRQTVEEVVTKRFR